MLIRRTEGSARQTPAPSVQRLLVLGALLALVASGLVHPAVAAREPGLEVVGRLPVPSPDDSSGGQVVEIDPIGQRMYYLYSSRADGSATYLIEYDIRPAIPRKLREIRIAAPNELPTALSPYTTSLDKKRNRLFIMAPTQIGVNQVLVVNLKRFELEDSWNVSAAVPGFLPYGMTFSPEDDRLYLVGDLSQSVVLGQVVGKVVGPGTAVLALDGDSGERAWVRPTPECQQVLDSYRVGALVARSEKLPYLYIPCVTGGSGAGGTYPGQAGLLQLTIDKQAGQDQAFQFPLEFFPISGAYSRGDGADGLAAYDQGSDRFYLQSLAISTPGTWVFDGRRSAWVGFIAAPDNNNDWLGLNEGSGHYYVGSGKDGGYLQVVDGRATPVPQGRVTGLKADGFIVADPGSRRLFVPQGVGGAYDIIIDHTPEAVPLRPLDYDELTSDIEEGPKTTTSFSGGVNGYGARAVLIGGYGGIVNILGNPVQIGDLRQGDRGFTAARVPAIDLRQIGASATAQAAIVDTNTEGELQDQQREWPWGPASCLDGSGKRIEQGSDTSGGTVFVACDLAKQTVTASSYFGPLSSGGVSVGASSFETKAWRDLKKGVMTESVASADGVTLTSPNGTVSIDRVEATATTAAHGRPGSTKAVWKRVLSGVEIREKSEDGDTVTRIGECSSSVDEDNCEVVVDAINDALQTRMRVDLYEPEVVETPKGAFAGVQQGNADFYHSRTVYNQGATFAAEGASRAIPALQVTVFNDSVERSRLVVQLAALQANSIYTISAPVPPPPVDPPPPPVETDLEPPLPKADTTSIPDVGTSGISSPPQLPPTKGAAVKPVSGGGSEPVAAEVDDAIPVAQGPVEGVLAMLRHSPAEALLFAGVWLLFGGAGWAVYRRRALVSLLVKEGRP